VNDSGGKPVAIEVAGSKRIQIDSKQTGGAERKTFFKKFLKREGREPVGERKMRVEEKEKEKRR
jgi:hypothetical protein